MQLRFLCSPRQRPQRVFRSRLLAIGSAILCATVILTGGIQRANADATSIYLYNSNGVAQNMGSDYSCSDHHVYDPLGTIIGTVDTNGNILNSSNQVIGYILIAV